ncbi:POTRA domain-containing protein, partial [Neisseria sp. P0015.S009]
PEDTEGRKLEPKYPVQISSDDEEVKEMLQEHLPLITEQQQENLDKEQVGFLAEDAPNDVQTMLKTKGYFNGVVNVVPQGEGYRVDVKT